MDLDLQRRLLDAVGLPRPEDPGSAELPRADGDAIARARLFIDMGVNPEETVAILLALTEGLGQAAEMCDSALNMLPVPGEDEIQLAQAPEEFARRARPDLLSMIGDLFLMRLRVRWRHRRSPPQNEERKDYQERATSPLRSPTWWVSPSWATSFRPMIWNGSRAGSRMLRARPRAHR